MEGVRANRGSRWEREISQHVHGEGAELPSVPLPVSGYQSSTSSSFWINCSLT
jgi:hypothetical protein